MDAGLEVREAFTIVSGARLCAAGADNVEEHLGGVLIVRMPWGDTPCRTSVALSGIAAAATAKTSAWSSGEILATRVVLASSLPMERSFCLLAGRVQPA